MLDIIAAYNLEVSTQCNKGPFFFYEVVRGGGGGGGALAEFEIK